VGHVFRFPNLDPTLSAFQGGASFGDIDPGDQILSAQRLKRHRFTGHDVCHFPLSDATNVAPVELIVAVICTAGRTVNTVNTSHRHASG
jgi:hypothetical protein